MFLLVLGLVLFVLLVIVHELGHFVAARRGGVEVEEFGLGFPPKIWAIKLKNKTLLSFNLLPLGGFVKLKGEHDADTEKGSFGAAPLKTKVKIMTAGVTMNLLTAFVMLTALAAIGMPKLVDNQFAIGSDIKNVKKEILAAYIEPDSPAEKSGLQKRDVLLAVGANETSLEPINDVNSFPEITKSLAGESIILKVRRDDETKTLSSKLRTTQEVNASKNTDSPKGYFGIVPTEYLLRRSTWSSPVVAAGTIGQFTELTLGGLGTALSNVFQGNGKEAAKQVSGPVGIFVVIKDGSLLGYQFILMIVAVISLTLAIMNILPIPALDGGRLFVTLLYRIMNKPLTKKTEDLIHGTGFALLMMLFLLITVVDVKRFF